MKIVEFLKRRYWLLYLMVALMLLVCHGKGVGLELVVAPYLVVTTLLLMITCRIKSLPGVLLPIFWLIPITVFSSINFTYFSDQSTPYIEYLSYSISMLCVALAFYAFLIRYPERRKIIYILFLVMFIVGVYRYLRSENIREVIGYAQQQNNAFYHVLMPLPLLLLTKNNVLKIIVLLITFAICFLSLKRSSIIVISLISLIYLWFNVVKGKRKFWTITLLLACITIGLSYMDKMELLDRYEKLVTRMEKLDSDGGSGRVDILKHFWEKDVDDINRYPEILIGKGFGATNNKHLNLAALHNDWAETYYSFGITGLVVLLWFFIRLTKNSIKMVKTKSSMQTAYLSAFLIFLFYSFSGGNFYFINTSLTLFAFLGVTEAMMKKNIETL